MTGNGWLEGRKEEKKEGSQEKSLGYALENGEQQSKC